MLTACASAVRVLPMPNPGPGAWTRCEHGHHGASRLNRAPRSQASNRGVRKPATFTPPIANGEVHDHTLLARITIQPGHCGGRPCICGLRIRVADILDLLSTGASETEILEDHPLLEPDDIRAAWKYAAIQADHAVLIAA